jgi:tetratricopeptide (TPR) repeat protein
LEAAQAFTEALGLIESQVDHSNPASSSSLNKQIITLINNRSAMYEKGNFPELSLEDCNKILEVYDMAHVKARTRKLRILERFQHNYQALVEVCALQLLYMQQNRDKFRMGLPASSPPPVPQSKLEELIALVMPEELEKYAAKMEADKKDSLPSNYTLLQLLKSYTGYNAWMAKAARYGAVGGLQKQLDDLPQSTDPTAVADKASLMMKMGRRYIYDCKYDKARDTIVEAYRLVKGKPEVQSAMKDDDYARLLEWTGMVRHWMYDLNGAEKCYMECSDLEPINVSNPSGLIIEVVDVFCRWIIQKVIVNSFFFFRRKFW